MSERDVLYEQDIRQHISKMVNILDFYQEKEQLCSE